MSHLPRILATTVLCLAAMGGCVSHAAPDMAAAPQSLNEQSSLDTDDANDMPPKMQTRIIKKFRKKLIKAGFILEGGPGFTKETAWSLPENEDESDILDWLPGYECYETREYHQDANGTPYLLRPGVIEIRNKKSKRFYDVTIWFNVSAHTRHSRKCKKASSSTK